MAKIKIKDKVTRDTIVPAEYELDGVGMIISETRVSKEEVKKFFKRKKTSKKKEG